MRRIVVLGGFGFFGAAAVERLKADGVTPFVASRRAEADVTVDVEDPSSLRRELQSGDVVIDTVGPFQDRTTTLVDVAVEVGFDVVDISDSVAYACKIYDLQSRMDAKGIRVLTSCSSISAVSAAMIRLSGIRDPIRLTGFLAPASRYVASPAMGISLLRSLGRPIRVLRDGRLTTRTGWQESRTLEVSEPIATIRGHLFESADSITLPKVWPSLQTVDFYVDSHVPGFNSVFAIAARSSMIRQIVERWQQLGLALARMLGSPSGCLAYEIEGRDGEFVHCALVASARGYFTPIVPAVLAARAIAEDRFEHRGLVTPDRHVDAEKLLEYLRGIGVEFIRLT